MLELLDCDCRFNSFVVNSQAGLSGQSVVAKYPCLFDSDNSRFYVWLGKTEVSLFGKTTFMNLATLAESKGA